MGEVEAANDSNRNSPQPSASSHAREDLETAADEAVEAVDHTAKGTRGSSPEDDASPVIQSPQFVGFHSPQAETEPSLPEPGVWHSAAHGFAALEYRRSDSVQSARFTWRKRRGLCQITSTAARLWVGAEECSEHAEAHQAFFIRSQRQTMNDMRRNTQPET